MATREVVDKDRDRVITTENGGRHRIMMVRDQKLTVGRKTETQLWTSRHFTPGKVEMKM